MGKRFKPRKQNLQKYIKGIRLLEQNPDMPIRDVCKAINLSATTFYHYKEMFGDNIKDDRFLELQPKSVPFVEKVAEKPIFSTKLEQILAENNAMMENIRLKRELGLIQ
jgi:hypothetical protein